MRAELMIALAVGLASQPGLAQTGLPQGINSIEPTSRTPRTPDVARRRARNKVARATRRAQRRRMK